MTELTVVSIVALHEEGKIRTERLLASGLVSLAKCPPAQANRSALLPRLPLRLRSGLRLTGMTEGCQSPLGVGAPGNGDFYLTTAALRVAFRRATERGKRKRMFSLAAPWT